MSIRAIIWDLGGVLLRTEDPLPRQRLAARLGLTSTALEAIVFGYDGHLEAQLGQIHAQQQWENACRAVKWPVEEIAAFRQAFLGGDRVDEALLDSIRGLRPRYLTGLLSNAMDDTRPSIENVWKMADAFDAILISAELGIIKPNPLIFQAAVQDLRVAPAEAVFIDDFEPNVVAAQGVGLHAIQFLNPQQAWADLERLLARA